jgi:hypothetical protein
MTENQTDMIACQMVRIFGLKAQREAAALCQKIAVRGDMDGVKSWTAVRRKICAIQIVHGDGLLAGGTPN